MIGRVEIHYAMVQSCTITDDKGTRPLLTDIGAQLFFVDVIEKDGARISMWDGRSYDDAIREAHILSKDFGPVFDLVIGGAK